LARRRLNMRHARLVPRPRSAALRLSGALPAAPYYSHNVSVHQHLAPSMLHPQITAPIHNRHPNRPHPLSPVEAANWKSDPP
jgi:hypothetical protein